MSQTYLRPGRGSTTIHAAVASSSGHLERLAKPIRYELAYRRER